MNVEQVARTYVSQRNKRETWPPGLTRTMVEAVDRFDQDEIGGVYLNIITAWVYAGADRALLPDELFALLTDKPWLADIEAEESQKQAAAAAVRDAAREAKRSMGRGEGSIEHLQQQLDWILLVLREKFGLVMEDEEDTEK